MFGYIVPDSPELKVKENEVYKAYYCGLCHSIKKNIGNLPRFSLTYDFAFLAMLFAGIKGIDESILLNRCIASPMRKKMRVADNQIMEYCAHMNVLLFYYKLKDNLKDDKNLLYLPLILIYRIKINKLLKKYPQKSDIIEKELNELMKLEKEKSNDIDLLSNTFGKIMDTVFSYDELLDDTKKIAGWMGFNLGKWIYVIDAFDDLKKDREKKRFNPLIIKEVTFEENKKMQKERVVDYLFSCLEETSNAYELLTIKQNKKILENIIYLGLLKKTRERCEINEKPI